MSLHCLFSMPSGMNYVTSEVVPLPEMKVDGAWMPVPRNKINNVIAPDGGAHVCAPKQEGVNKGVLFCVVLPPDG
jgi:hypothetical protein